MKEQRMQHPQCKQLAAAGISAVALLGLSACSSSGANSPSSMQESSSAPTLSSSMITTAPAGAASNLIGAGCKVYAEQVPSGPGSVEGMSADPVTVAASNNPMLTTLTSALSGKLNPGVNLIDTLNNGQFTVFAPTDDAFKKLPASTIESLKTDSATLTKILTYHVVQGQLAPDKVAGSHPTVQGETVIVSGSGDGLKVNDSGLVCGGVKTANATVYMIDTVLMPPM
jgi:uncharacterized surface protein with fasciclin (FAS1) repeats